MTTSSPITTPPPRGRRRSGGDLLTEVRGHDRGIGANQVWGSVGDHSAEVEDDEAVAEVEKEGTVVFDAEHAEAPIVGDAADG
jgi:hypothetical protein